MTAQLVQKNNPGGPDRLAPRASRLSRGLFRQRGVAAAADWGTRPSNESELRAVREDCRRRGAAPTRRDRRHVRSACAPGSTARPAFSAPSERLRLGILYGPVGPTPIRVAPDRVAARD
jgi:hypothetical protein